MQESRQVLREVFAITGVATGEGFDADLWQGILEDAADPETEVPKWLAEGCPTGAASSDI